MTPKVAEAYFTPDQDRGQWQHVTPGERFKIRVSSAQTMGAYSVIEIVADPGNGVPLHIHNKVDEHLIVVEGTLDIANGDRRWDASAGTSVTVRRGVPHAWCNPSDTPLRMLVVFSPGHIEGLFRATAGVDDVDRITAIAARYGTKLVGPPLRGTAHSIHPPQRQPTAEELTDPQTARNGDAGAAGRLYEASPVLTAFRSRTEIPGESAMEMHSQRSLYEIHGINAPPRPQSRWSRIARRAINRLLVVLTRMTEAIQAELAARRAIEELAGMNDHMLRDLGITRGEIESEVRRPRVNVGTDDGPVLSNDTGQSYPALPTISSPDLTIEGGPEAAITETVGMAIAAKRVPERVRLDTK
jgi:mannose-6-phosphate isomerase-like protein (cupin superfamily)/uncharacterized protein YjiS (DUF1127 family)